MRVRRSRGLLLGGVWKWALESRPHNWWAGPSLIILPRHLSMHSVHKVYRPVHLAASPPRPDGQGDYIAISSSDSTFALLPSAHYKVSNADFLQFTRLRIYSIKGFYKITDEYAKQLTYLWGKKIQKIAELENAEAEMRRIGDRMTEADKALVLSSTSSAREGRNRQKGRATFDTSATLQLQGGRVASLKGELDGIEQAIKDFQDLVGA